LGLAAVDPLCAVHEQLWAIQMPVVIGPCRVMSRRRQPPRVRSAPPPSLLAVLDLRKPGERQAHVFLPRATSKRDRMWTLLTIRRQ